MRIIPSFDEYINERLFQNSIDRIKSGESRKEDLTPLDNICKFSAEFIAKKLKIDYKPELCSYSEDEEYNTTLEHEDSKSYFISMNFSEIGFEFDDMGFNLELDMFNDKFNDSEYVYSEFASGLDIFQDEMNYDDYKDPYISGKKEFNKIKRTLSQLVDEIQKKF